MDGEPRTPVTKENMMEYLRPSRRALEEVVGQMGDEELARPGPDGWSPKDHLAHLATWEQSLIALLEGRPRYEAMGFDQATYEQKGLDGLNELIYERNRDKPADEVLAFFRGSHEQLLRTLDALTDDDLVKPYSHYQPDDPPYNPNPVIGWIAGNTWGHYDEHRAAISAIG